VPGHVPTGDAKATPISWPSPATPEPRSITDPIFRIGPNAAVVEAPIVPSVFSSNTKVAALMIRQKGPNMILQDATTRPPITVAAYKF
jgi:hypothetical protein